jgi:predicted nucleic acid-binding protein
MLIDSSAWAEYLRATGSAQHLSVRAAIAAADAHTTDTVRLELLCGALGGGSPDAISRLLDGCVNLAQLGRDDVHAAARIYRLCRRSGETIRRPNDCMIAAVAIRNGVAVLHRDKDFDVIARYSDLEVVAA